MRVLNPELLKAFRTPGFCEFCKRWCDVREGHHLWPKGFGGGGQMDVPCNLIALGSTLCFQCPCHTEIHAGNIQRNDLLLIVARRERCLQGDIEAEVHRIRRLPKGSDYRCELRRTG